VYVEWAPCLGTHAAFGIRPRCVLQSLSAGTFQEPDAHPDPATLAAIQAAIRERWIQLASPAPSQLLSVLSLYLHRGEAEAIALAVDLKAEVVIIDEQEGRQLAAEAGLFVTGVLGVLLRAKQRGHIPALTPEISVPPQQGSFFHRAISRSQSARRRRRVLGRRQAALHEPTQEAWFLSMLVLKLADVGLDFRRAPQAEPQVPEVFEELDGLIVIVRTLGGDECVYLGPRVRLALSESGKILLTSRCRLALAPGALPCLALRSLTVPLFTVPSRQCQEVPHRAWLRRRARRVGTLTRGSKATQQLRPDVRRTFSC
jgi:hypothetical protein